MVREDRVIMSVKELRRVHVIRQTREQTLTPVKAGTLRGLRTRHIRRLIERVEPEGDRDWRIGDEGCRRTGGSRRRSRPRRCGGMRSGMEMLGRRWRRRNSPSARGPDPCCDPAAVAASARDRAVHTAEAPAPGVAGAAGAGGGAGAAAGLAP